MNASKTKIVLALQCAAFACATNAFAESGDETPPKYFLHQDVAHNVTGGCAIVNAKWWQDEAGVKGADGETPDPAGDYYTGGYRLDTVNTQNNDVLFECNSLHIGEVGGSSSLFNVYSSNGSVFSTGGLGLFLHNGRIVLNWMPVTIGGIITVDSPETAPFRIFDRYFNTVLYVEATLRSGYGSALRFHESSSDSKDTDTGDRTFVVRVSGDCSGYYGSMIIGSDSAQGGRCTRLHPPEGGMPGSLRVKATGSVAVDSGDVVVGGVVFENGSTINAGKGCLVVTNSFSASGTVNVGLSGIPNLENPRFAVITVPAGSGMSADGFVLSASDAVNFRSAAFSVEENADGTSTLYVTLERNSVYVSPDGDDGNSGADADNPLRTLAHAVSVLTNGVIYALPGTYNDGLCDQGDSKTQSRVRVPPDVYLKSTGGNAVTTIEGAPADDGGNCGAGATRCAKLDGNAVLEGFTLTGGYVYSDNAGKFDECAGGAVHAGRNSLILDCYIYGNTARRGGGGYGGNYLRTVFGTNTALHGTWTGPDLFGQGNNAWCFDCMFLSHSNGYVHVYQYCRLYNCTFTTEKYGGVQYESKAYNCLIRCKSHVTCAYNTQYYNCVLAMEPNSPDAGLVTNCTITGLTDAIDAEGRPTAGSPVIDIGNRDEYLQGWDETGLSRTFLDGDFHGGQRIYNGRIDVGAVEYDWRDGYTGIVAKRRMEVVQASEDVEAVGQEMLKLVDGTKLQIDWDCTNGGESLRMACAATVTGSGTLTVKMDGTVIATVTEGNASVTWKSTDESHVLEFSYSGDGEARVGTFENKNGLRVRIR